MSFQGSDQYTHGVQSGIGILLTNLGTPDAPTPAALRRYLAEFLWDPRVVEMNRAVWWCVLQGVILRIRPARSAHAYQKIWTEQGSPLLTIARRQADALQTVLRQRLPGPLTVALGMRYGNPSIASALQQLREQNVQRLLVLPLYPQYSASTTAATFDAVSSELKTWRRLPELRMVNHYHDDAGYIDALAEGIQLAWRLRPPAERLLFSFHGIPKRFFMHGDPYHCECLKTARLVAEKLQLPPERWFVAFQSRFGREPWLQPYADHTLREWGSDGVASVDVVCPGFSADCLETLEEVAMVNRDIFLDAGGRDYHYIPALNDNPAHITALCDLVQRHLQGWPEADAGWQAAQSAIENEASRQRALTLGAVR